MKKLLFFAISIFVILLILVILLISPNLTNNQPKFLNLPIFENLLTYSQKQADNWVGFYYPEGIPKVGEAICETQEFEKETECENWGKVKSQEKDGAEYYCGYQCKYDSSCQYACSQPQPTSENTNEPGKISVNQNESINTSSVKFMENCDLSEYGLDCDIVKGLEENLASANNPNGVNFCTYEILDVQGKDYYLQALCEEFYPQNKTIICPDEESTKACFGNEKQECKNLCNIQEIEPYLANGSGISVPVKLTITEEGFTLWKPRDGSYYAKDLKENLTQTAYDKLDDVDGWNFRAINRDRAEKYFSVKIPFKNAKKVDQSCETYADCTLPMDYAIRSDCPYEMRCSENQCEVGCYDSSGYPDFPIVKEYSWEDAKEIINSGEVAEVFQSHSLNVKIKLKDGTEIFLVEPQVVSI